MTLPIFPSSPVWANLQRQPVWNESVQMYDSGKRQGSTPWHRPLYKYNINISNMPETKQSSLHAFWNDLKGRTMPFLFKDPYDYVANGVAIDTTSMGVGSGFYFLNANSWAIIPDSGNILVTAGDSGALSNGIDYVLSLDNGWCQIVHAPTSSWVGSFEYFRKVAFDAQYGENSAIWNNFSGSLVIQEMLPNG